MREVGSSLDGLAAPVGDRRSVILYFETFHYTERIELSLAENERIVNVVNLTDYRQVWIERETARAAREE